MHIHFNDEPRNLSNPDHLEAGGKGTWAEKMVYCEDCWYWPWQVREATSTVFELLSSGEKLPNYLLRRWSCLQETWVMWRSMRSVISLASAIRQTSRQLCIQRYGFPRSTKSSIFWNILRKIFLCIMTCCPADVGHSPSGGASQ